MSTIVTRSGKGSPLTNTEVDANFTNLNTGKAELSGAVFTGAITTNSTIDGRDVATDGTKLDGVEASADVTDTANVTAAGALMDSELTSIASVKALNQGVATGDSPTFVGINASGNLTLDVAGDIILDADGGNVKLLDGGVVNLDIYKYNSNVYIENPTSNSDIIFSGNDGGSTITALTLDMSAAGQATFNSNVISGGGLFALNGDGTYAKGLTIAKSGEQQHYIYSSGATQTNAIGSSAANWVWKQEGGANKMTLSAAGAATFSSTVTSTGLTSTGGGSISGNLLVGASSAAGKLTVGTFGDTARAAQFHGGSILVDGGAASEIIIGDGNVAYMSIQTTDDATAMKIRNYSGNADLVTIERASGNVGIGTSSPVRPLSVKGSQEQLTLSEGDARGATFDYRSSTGNLNIATNGINARTSPQFTLDLNGNVGIGCTPSAKLHIKGGSDMGIRIESDNDGYANLQFGDADDVVRGSISYNNADDSLQLRGYNNTERMRIDSSGNVLVGKTGTAFGTAGIEARSGGTLWATASGTNAASFNRLSSDGAIAYFSKDGTTVGSIGTNGGRPYFVNSVDGGIHLATDGYGRALVLPANESGAPEDNLHYLGSSSYRWRDLYLSGGVYLGGTGAANKLDDYEEGTWTPAWTGSTSTVNVSSAVYTKIGNLVTVHAYLTNISPATSADTQTITGLPFLCASSNHYGTGTIVYSADADVEGIRILVHTGASHIYFHLVDGNGAAPTRNDWNTIKSSGLPFLFSATYRTDQ